MLTTKAAKEAIALAMPAFGSEPVDTVTAYGRVLRQTVLAERDQPPFDRVTMDGIAISYDALDRGTRSFRIAGTQHAGDAVSSLLPGRDTRPDHPHSVEGDGGDTHCVEIMTGAVLPVGSDCVVPVERITVSNEIAEIEQDYHAERWQFVHLQGSDHRAGTPVLEPGAVLTPAEIAIVASCGLERVEVSRQPAIRVISTGNELVPAGKPVLPHQVRLSNGPAVVAMLKRQGFEDCRHEHLLDDPHSLRASIGRLLGEARVLILSGGVSMGKADFVPQVLAGLGVRTVFHKISQRPGKPMWFGIGPDDQSVFALPGNPVSTLVCCRHYVLPALFDASGRHARRPEWAVLTEDVTFKADLSFFMPVVLQSDVDGILRARPVPTNTSGDFTALGGTDGYVELAREQSHFPQGSPVPLHRWDAP
jgi:molybdopterin molybdotransferase